MTEFIDVSLEIGPRLPVWPGDPAIRIERIKDIKKGDTENVTVLSLGVHAGTHIDAPLHYVGDGPGVSDLKLQTLIGPVFVASVPDEVSVVTNEVLANLRIKDGVSRLLLKTKNSRIWSQPDYRNFDERFVALDSTGSKWLVDKKISLIGIDYLSIQTINDVRSETHKVLLNAGVVIVEGLNLSRVEQGEYEMICLPIKINNSDGAPARVVLRKLIP